MQRIVEAARGMGLSGSQVLFRVEVPMAAPLILTGLRLAAVLIVATAGLAALIAGGGLGRYIVDGVALRENDRVIAGSILIAVLAILTDVLFTYLTKVFSPRLSSTGRGAPALGSNGEQPLGRVRGSNRGSGHPHDVRSEG